MEKDLAKRLGKITMNSDIISPMLEPRLVSDPSTYSRSVRDDLPALTSKYMNKWYRVLSNKWYLCY